MTAFRVSVAAGLAAALLLAAPAGAQTSGSIASDYPTVARADYVFGCMAANGETRQALERCSCSIDVIASILPYERYVEAETVMSIARVGGENTSIFRSAPSMQKKVAELRRAQAEAEIRCF
jgi:lysyl-tRNA synthetase class II